MKHLWEYDHPYYCSETEYHTDGFGNNNHGLHEFDSWESFFAEWGESDPDMNLVFRWDWKSAEQRSEDYDEPIEDDLLEVFFVLQRKGLFVPCHITVTPEDEPAVREWLTERAKTIAALWDLNVPCSAVINCGPGHQSTIHCERSDYPHETHHAVHPGSQELLEWKGEKGTTTFFDASPLEEEEDA